MKIQAKIPFTYLYPEEEPSEKRYWINETITAEGDEGAYWAEFVNSAGANTAGTMPELSFVIDGVHYDNVPQDPENYTYGAPPPASPDDPWDWSEYPFSFGDGAITISTDGEHSVAIIYNSPMVTLTLENSGEGTDAPGQYYYASFDENGIFKASYYLGMVDPTATPETIGLGESVTLTVPVNARFDETTYQIAFILGDSITIEESVNADFNKGLLVIDDITTPECSVAAEWAGTM